MSAQSQQEAPGNGPTPSAPQTAKDAGDGSLTTHTVPSVRDIALTNKNSWELE